MADTMLTKVVVCCTLPEDDPPMHAKQNDPRMSYPASVRVGRQTYRAEITLDVVTFAAAEESAARYRGTWDGVLSTLRLEP